MLIFVISVFAILAAVLIIPQSRTVFEKLSADQLVAVFIGDEVMYNYIYTAALNASETEAQQIGGILYTIKEEM